MKAKKQLGQNFLTNETIIKKIVSLFMAKENDLILEIGPGKGALTKELKKLNSNLIAIEIDTDMSVYLNKLENNKTKIIYENFLNIGINEILKNYNYENLYIIGNLPYYITSPILEKIIKSKINAKKMIFMVQDEVADRFSGINKGYMSLYLDFYYDVKKEIFVKRDNFNPIPKVDSSVISLTKKETVYNINEEQYFNFLKIAFSQKRKTLKNNLKSFNLENVSTNLNKRAEELSNADFIQLFLELHQ